MLDLRLEHAQTVKALFVSLLFQVNGADYAFSASASVSLSRSLGGVPSEGFLEISVPRGALSNKNENNI